MALALPDMMGEFWEEFGERGWRERVEVVKLVVLGHVDGLREAIKCLEGRHGIIHVTCI